MKYIITSSKSVLTLFKEYRDNIEIKIESNGTPIYFDTIGDAMRCASNVNKILCCNSFKAIIINK